MNLGIVEIKNQLGSMYTGYTVRCRKKIAELILKDGFFFWHDRLCCPNVRCVGNGVWEVFLEDKKHISNDIHCNFK
jgi:hypothetical protein